MKKVDIDAFGIDIPLAKQYNKIIFNIDNNTIIENGCINDRILNIEYIRREINFFSTEDYIKIRTKSFGSVRIKNPKELNFNKKYNCLELYDLN